MNLIIVAGLTEPPTETLPFRDVTSTSKCDYKMNVQIESQQEMKDLYWRFMRKTGMFDYVEDIVTPEEREEGLRVDFELNYPKTILAKSIDLGTQKNLLEHIAILSVIK